MAMLLLAGLIILGAVWYSRRRGRRWEANAHALGLTLAPVPARSGLTGSGPWVGQPMVGERDGFRVEIGTRMVVRKTRNGTSTKHWTYVRVRFPQSLGIDATLRANRWWTRAWEAIVGQCDAQVGHEEVDRLYTVRAADIGVAEQLVRQPGVSDALIRSAHAAFPPRVSDTEVYCETTGQVLGLERQAVALRTAVELAKAITSGCASMGLSPIQQTVHERWRVVAQRHGLSVDARQRTMSGSLDGTRVVVRAQAAGSGPTTLVRAHLEPALGLRLHLGPETRAHAIGKMVGLSDIRTTDPAFDDAFFVRGDPHSAVIALLGDEVRACLLDLGSRARISATDDALTVEYDGLIEDPERLERAVFDVARAANALLGRPPGLNEIYR